MPAKCGHFYVQDVLYVARVQDARSDHVQEKNMVKLCNGT